MVERFFILISLILGGIPLAESTSFPSPSTLISELETGILSNSVSSAIQLADCGVGCDMLIQKTQEVKSAELDSLISELLDHYASVYHKEGPVYFTLKHLKEEIKFEQGMFDKMKAVEFDKDTGYYEGMIKDLQDQIKKHQESLDKMEEEHLVMIVSKGQMSYMTSEDYKYMVRKEKLVKNVESFILDNMNSAQLYDLYDALDALKGEVKSDDSVTILGVDYTYSDLVTYTESISDLSKETEHKEKLQASADSIGLQYSTSGQYWLKSEVKSLLDSWDELIKLLTSDDLISIMGVDFDLASSREKYYELKGIYQKLHTGEVATFNSKGDLEVVVTPLVKTSGEMSGADYFDLIKSAASRKKNVPIIKTDEVFMQVSGFQHTLTQFSGASGPETFLQTADQVADEQLQRDSESAPSDSSAKGNEYQDGELSLLLVTTFLANATGTGKVVAFDAYNPENYIELLNGFEKPTGVCYDVNHDFLYVVESSGNNSGIYQFQVERSKTSMKFANGVYVIVYYGNPLDCKVDGYGNLYFTDKSDQSIKKMTYSDLYFGYTNTEITVYSYTYGIDQPASLELVESKSLYFVNTGNSTNDGTVNVANVQIDEENSKDIDVLVQETFPAAGIAVTDKRIFYSLSTGAIKSYNRENKEVYTYSRELDEPKGICSSDGKVFALDYSQGMIFVGNDEFTDDMDLFLYVQAPYSCFCLNWKESKLSFASALVVGLVVLSVF